METLLSELDAAGLEGEQVADPLLGPERNVLVIINMILMIIYYLKLAERMGSLAESRRCRLCGQGKRRISSTSSTNNENTAQLTKKLMMNNLVEIIVETKGRKF